MVDVAAQRPIETMAAIYTLSKIPPSLLIGGSTAVSVVLAPKGEELRTGAETLTLGLGIYGAAKLTTKGYKAFQKKITKARVMEGRTELVRGVKLKKGKLIEEGGATGKVEVYKELFGKKWGRKVYDVGVTSQKIILKGKSNYTYRDIVLVKGKEGLHTFCWKW